MEADGEPQRAEKSAHRVRDRVDRFTQRMRSVAVGSS
jgi:hypothetical protein